MAFNTERRPLAGVGQQAAIDEGLRAHMLKVYNYMASGLALSGIFAALVANTSLINVFFSQAPGGYWHLNMVGWIMAIGTLGLVFFMSARINALRFATAQILFWTYASLMGITLSNVLLNYTGASVTRVFFITAGTFAAMSLYGYTTKRDLTGWGNFLMMGLIGIIIAVVVNVFLQSPALYFAISVIGVLVFVGLTAYDTQSIKNQYSEFHDDETSGKLALMGALRLYLDFINLFLMLLHLFGNRD